ncbi:MAG: CPBP family intramembrane metalloprotease [Chitinophagaceae bacterium]|nr:CPBP family intramembrane metalloprotease [Chitinophagaceae bacterium]
MGNLIVLLIMLILPFVLAVRGKYRSKGTVINKTWFYIKDICVNISILLLLLVLNSSIYHPLNFEKIGKGIIIPPEITTIIIIFFVLPFFHALINRNINRSNKVTFGYPTQFLPDNLKEFLIFNIYVIVGVLFEELICRQSMFYSFNSVLSLKGDKLLLLSSFLFSVGHLYQGWKGIISSFILGMSLGKLFQISENLIFPIILHMIFNLSISVYAYRKFSHKTIKNLL